METNSTGYNIKENNIEKVHYFEAE